MGGAAHRPQSPPGPAPPAARCARSPLAFGSRGVRLSRTLQALGTGGDPPPCAVAVRNPMVTIVIIIFIINDSDNYYLFTFLDYTMFNSAIEGLGWHSLKLHLGAARSSC